MEESKISEGRHLSRKPSSPSSPTAAVNGGINGAHPDGGLAYKFSYWRGRGIWGRSPESSNSAGRDRAVDPGRFLIDTAAPFESVKAAADRFGGTADWKVQRALSMERNRNVQQELEKMEQKLALCQKHAEEFEEANGRVLQELEASKRFIEELRFRLDKAQTEEAETKQDSELALFRVKEMEQGIGEEASVAAKAQVNVAKTRYMEAVVQLTSVDTELDVLRKDYDRLEEERSNVTKKAEKAVLASKESEKRVEELTLELISMKEVLELTQASHVEAEEQKLDAAMEMAEDPLNWEQQIKEVQEEVRCLDEQISAAIILDLRLRTTSAFLSPLKQQSEKIEEDMLRSNQEALASAKELAEVKASMENSKEDVICLKAEAETLMSELETEASCVSAQKQRKAELEAKESSMELEKAREEAELAKARESSMELKLQAVTKEIEAAMASEKSALDAIRALQESEAALGNAGFEGSPNVLTLTLEEYNALKATAVDAESLADKRAAAAMKKIDEAKEKESASLERMEAGYREVREKEDALKDATMKAERAEERKLEAEQKLREWRDQVLKRRKEGEESLSGTARCCYTRSSDGSRGSNSFASAATARASSTSSLVVEYSSAKARDSQAKPTGKRSFFFPRIIMFLARKKVQSLR